MAVQMADVAFRLSMEHDDFTDEVCKQFIEALAHITHCSPDEIQLLSVKRGCINVRLKMPDKAAKEFLSLFRNFLENHRDLDSCSPELRQFLTNFSVDNYTRYVSDLHIVVKREPAKKAVIFVHGWSGGEDTFAEWPDYLWDEYRCAVSVFPYPSGLISESPSIVHVADALRNWIKNRLPDSSIAFVAHSLGGIVVRRFVISSHDNRDRLDLHVKNIAFIASPHNGLGLARVANVIPGIKSEQLSDLSDRSPLLHDLNRRWLAWVSSYVPEHCKLMSLYGTKDAVVTSVNSIGSDEDAIPILGKTHIDIVKPRSHEDEIVLTFRRFLNESRFFDEAKKTIDDKEKEEEKESVSSV